MTGHEEEPQPVITAYCPAEGCNCCLFHMVTTDADIYIVCAQCERVVAIFQGVLLEPKDDRPN